MGKLGNERWKKRRWKNPTFESGNENWKHAMVKLEKCHFKLGKKDDGKSHSKVGKRKLEKLEMKVGKTATKVGKKNPFWNPYQQGRFNINRPKKRTTRFSCRLNKIY